VNSFNSQCPSTKIVLVGYSQVSLKFFRCHRIQNGE
jgi:hypothetical protein